MVVDVGRTESDAHKRLTAIIAVRLCQEPLGAVGDLPTLLERLTAHLDSHLLSIFGIKYLRTQSYNA